MTETVVIGNAKLIRELGPLPEATLLVDCAQGFVKGWTAGNVRAFAAEQVAAERERWKDLAFAFLRLDELGFIGSYGEEGDDECSHWLSIARAGLADALRA